MKRTLFVILFFLVAGGEFIVGTYIDSFNIKLSIFLIGMGIIVGALVVAIKEPVE